MEVDKNSHLILFDSVSTDNKCGLKCPTSSCPNPRESRVRLGLGREDVWHFRPIKNAVLTCINSLKYMCPVCGMIAALENPDKVFFWDPNKRTLQAGILDKLVSPPADPMSLAAVDAPTMIDRLGAMNVILDSTY